MAIQLDLTPEEEAWLREHAARLGTAPELLATDLLRGQLPAGSGPAEIVEELLPVVDEHGVFHEERWQAVEQRLSRLFAGRPALSSEALTREQLYRDHD